MSLYDQIGNNYSRTRRTDPRIQAAISKALSGCKLVLNVGAGTGSYEPKDRQVVSLDPSFVMLEQRQDRSNVIRGIAELLPFSNQSFDAAMGVLTVDHWTDKSLGLKEMQRVVRNKVVIFTWDKSRISESWMWWDYFPSGKELVLKRSVPIETYAKALEGPVEIIPVPIPAECADGFDGAYWRRPADVLEPTVWQNMSTLRLIPDEERTKGLERLALELGNGAWNQKYGHHGTRAPDIVGHTTVRIELFVDDPYEVYEKALAAGAIVRSPVEEHSYPTTGPQPIKQMLQGVVVDPFGHMWLIGKILE